MAVQEVRALLPTDRNQRWLPEPIPASYYARAAAAHRRLALPVGRWAAEVRRWPHRRAIAAAAVVVIGAALVSELVQLATSSQTAPTQRTTVALASPATIGLRPRATPLAIAPTPTPTATPTPTPTAHSTPAPTPPRVSISNAPLSAPRGQPVTLLAVTAPRTTCAIALGYPSAPALAPATSDGAGKVSWTWTVDRHASQDTWPVQVSCGGGTASTTITITED